MNLSTISQAARLDQKMESIMDTMIKNPVGAVGIGAMLIEMEDLEDPQWEDREIRELILVMATFQYNFISNKAFIKMESEQ